MFMLPWVQSVILCHLPICEIRVTTCTYFESKVFGFIYWDILGYIRDATLFSNKGNVPFAPLPPKRQKRALRVIVKGFSFDYQAENLQLRLKARLPRGCYFTSLLNHFVDTG